MTADPTQGGRDCIGMCVKNEHMDEYLRWTRSVELKSRIDWATPIK